MNSPKENEIKHDELTNLMAWGAIDSCPNQRLRDLAIGSVDWRWAFHRHKPLQCRLESVRKLITAYPVSTQ